MSFNLIKKGVIMAIKWTKYRNQLKEVAIPGKPPIGIINRKMEKDLNEIMVSALPSLAQKRRRAYKVKHKG